MQQELLNTKALFTDQTQEYLKVQIIKPLRKSGRKRYAIHIRLRTAAGEVDRSVLLTDQGEIRMQVEKENAHFIYFSADVESDGRPVRYAFRLRLAAGGEEVLYRRTGVVTVAEAKAEQAAAAVAAEKAAAENAAAEKAAADEAVASQTDKKEGAEEQAAVADQAGQAKMEAAAGKSKTAGWWYFAPEFKAPEWAQGAVMYQIFTDRFYNGDPSNDVLTGEYAYNGGQVEHIGDWYCPPAPDDTREHYGGDLQGIMDKLDYLEDLGVEVIYLNPIFVSPSNHKYDTQDYDHIDPHFGKIVHDHGELLPKSSLDNRKATKYKARVTDPANLEASDRLFANLVREAHMRGIRVILDGVFNHCGSFHRWMDREKIYLNTGNYAPGAYGRKDSGFRDYFDFKKDSWPDNDSYESWWGYSSLPKLNYEKSMQLRDEILRIAAKWVSPPYNADGWRLDVASDLGHSEIFNHYFWQRFRKVVKKANPEAIILAENYVDSAKWLQGREWDTIMNYEGFMDPVTWFLTGMEKHNDAFHPDYIGDPERFWKAAGWKEQDDIPQAAMMCSMNQLSNHDHSRFLTRTGLKVGRMGSLGSLAAADDVRESVYREAAVIQMTWPGAPTLYYGDEAGLCGFTDPDNRRTYPWGRENREMIRFHRELIRMHKEYDCLRTGSLIRLADDTGVLSYGRFDRESSVVVALNNSNDPVTVQIPVIYAGVPANSQMKLRFLTNMNGFLAYPRTVYHVVDGVLKIELAPESAAVLVK